MPQVVLLSLFPPAYSTSLIRSDPPLHSRPFSPFTLRLTTTYHLERWIDGVCDDCVDAIMDVSWFPSEFHHQYGGASTVRGYPPVFHDPVVLIPAYYSHQTLDRNPQRKKPTQLSGRIAAFRHLIHSKPGTSDTLVKTPDWNICFKQTFHCPLLFAQFDAWR